MSRTRPLSVRPLTDVERQVLQDSLRAADAFVLRRAQIVLASAAGERSGQIAPRVGFTTQGVRDVLPTSRHRRSQWAGHAGARRPSPPPRYGTAPDPPAR